jgi:hypothetical protein
MGHELHPRRRPGDRRRQVTGWIVYSIILTAAVLVFIGVPLAFRRK